ncbi:AzlC family ABC transporter permease [Haliea sp. E17]|uniref:AzlC family ABC transporter permease n=1 Tax=Haliea sp. E17 TaxID=3401576 RepID=UPI003AAF80D3
MQDSRTVIRRGVIDALPYFVPAIPFALILGVAILHSGLLAALGWSSSWIIYGGASQLTLITLLDDGAAAAVTAALIVNARHLMYSAGLAPVFQQQPRWFHWVGPYFMVDQVFALGMLNRNLPADEFRCYYLSIGITFWLLWLVATAAGLFIGPVVPVDWELGFAVPVMFTALVVMAIDRWPKLLAALVAAAVAWFAAELPHRSGLLLGALAGMLTGACCEVSRR